MNLSGSMIIIQSQIIGSLIGSASNNMGALLAYTGNSASLSLTSSYYCILGNYKGVCGNSSFVVMVNGSSASSTAVNVSSFVLWVANYNYALAAGSYNSSVI